MELLTVSEVARLLKVSPITVRRHIASGELPAVRAGRRIRVLRESVDSYLTPVIQENYSGANQIWPFPPPTAEELARRHAAVDRILELRAKIPVRPGPSAVELIRMAREEEGFSYDPGDPDR